MEIEKNEGIIYLDSSQWKMKKINKLEMKQVYKSNKLKNLSQYQFKINYHFFLFYFFLNRCEIVFENNSNLMQFPVVHLCKIGMKKKCSFHILNFTSITVQDIEYIRMEFILISIFSSFFLSNAFIVLPSSMCPIIYGINHFH